MPLKRTGEDGDVLDDVKAVDEIEPVDSDSESIVSEAPTSSREDRSAREALRLGRLGRMFSEAALWS